jgi:hypothetical protein
MLLRGLQLAGSVMQVRAMKRMSAAQPDTDQRFAEVTATAFPLLKVRALGEALR